MCFIWISSKIYQPQAKLTVGEQFYLRLLWTYLFGIYCASTQLTAAYMWHEMVARRGANDVISCLSHFIYHSRLGRTGAKWSIWWADNCPGQNKNNYIMWFFQELIHQKVYSRIDYKFLVVGHTYGPTDRSFGVIEHYTSRIESLYSPLVVWTCEKCSNWNRGQRDGTIVF